MLLSDIPIQTTKRFPKNHFMMRLTPERILEWIGNSQEEACLGRCHYFCTSEPLGPAIKYDLMQLVYINANTHESEVFLSSLFIHYTKSINYSLPLTLLTLRSTCQNSLVSNSPITPRRYGLQYIHKL